MEHDQPAARKSRRWKWWIFAAINLLGLILILPLLKLTVPLIGIWWHTRSQASLQSGSALPSVAPPEADTNLTETKETVSTNALPAEALQPLTNQLSIVDSMSEKELQQIVAQHFGVVAPGETNKSGQFDLASAVFDSISKTNVVYRGKTYFGYLVDLVDQNGRHKTNVDCFVEPDLEYERSLQTLQLINGSPQLKKIYRAMAGSLAAKSANATNAGPEPVDNPVLRLEPGADKP
jgi:hypothetical protein